MIVKSLYCDRGEKNRRKKKVRLLLAGNFSTKYPRQQPSNPWRFPMALKDDIHWPPELIDTVCAVLRDTALSKTVTRDDQINRLRSVIPSSGPYFESIWPAVQTELARLARLECLKRHNIIPHSNALVLSSLLSRSH